MSECSFEEIAQRASIKATLAEFLPYQDESCELIVIWTIKDVDEVNWATTGMESSRLNWILDRIKFEMLDKRVVE